MKLLNKLKNIVQRSESPNRSESPSIPNIIERMEVSIQSGEDPIVDPYVGNPANYNHLEIRDGVAYPSAYPDYSDATDPVPLVRTKKSHNIAGKTYEEFNQKLANQKLFNDSWYEHVNEGDLEDMGLKFNEKPMTIGSKCLRQLEILSANQSKSFERT